MGKEKHITVSLKSFLEGDLRKIMEEYEKYRFEIANTASEGGEIEEALKEEVIWEGKIKHIKDLLKNKKAVRSAKQNETVSLGSRVVISVNGKKKTIIIDGVGYKTKEVEIVSQYSLVGESLIGKKTGDTVVVGKGAVISVEEVLYPW